MDENKRWEQYPSIFYAPDGKWCAFNFSVLTQFVDLQKGFVMPENGEFNAEHTKEYNRIFQQNKKEFEDKFPIAELIKKHEQEEQIKRFTGIKEQTLLIPREDNPGILIATNIPIYCTQLNIEIAHSHLQVQMHNGGCAQIGLSMVAYGLRALKTLYDAYGIHSENLPKLDFQKDSLNVVVPIPHSNTDNAHDLRLEENGWYGPKAKNLKAELLEDKITFQVPYKIGNAKIRSELAFAMLEKTTQQAKHNLFIAD